MIYLSTTNEQGFVYYFGIFYLKIGKFYTFFQLGKGPVMGPKISPGKSLVRGAWLHSGTALDFELRGPGVDPCCVLEQGTLTLHSTDPVPIKPWLWLDMNEKLLTEMVNLNTNKEVLVMREPEGGLTVTGTYLMNMHIKAT